MEVVFSVKYRQEKELCGIIDSFGKQDFHNIPDLHNLSSRLKKKANKSQLLTLRLNPARYIHIFFIPLTSHQNIHSRIGISKNNAKEHICFNQILMSKNVQAKLTIISFFLHGNVFFMKLKIQFRSLFYGYLLLPIFYECITQVLTDKVPILA